MIVKRQGAEGRLLKMVQGLLERGRPVKEVSEWARVDEAFVTKIASKLQTSKAKTKRAKVTHAKQSGDS